MAAEMKTWLIQGDARHIPLADGSVQCVVTSPPYFGLRDYGTAAQIGLEQTPAAYVANLVAVCREVCRVLRDDGVFWLNIGDSYANDAKWGGTTGGKHVKALHGESVWRGKKATGLKAKDLIGIPWRVAFALQEDGWYLRSDIIWSKRSPMPESVRDRPTRSHEYIFLLTKSDRYFYDAEAVKEVAVTSNPADPSYREYGKGNTRCTAIGVPPGANEHSGFDTRGSHDGKRNRRTVWTLSNQPMKEAHFATFPPKLVEPCVMAGTSERGACPACGAPWKRIVDRVRVATREGKDSKVNAACDCKGWGCPKCDPDQKGRPDAKPGIVTGNRDPKRHVTQTVTSGWVPTCKCPAHEPRPCLVLDPFSGAGTTAMVCARLGRSAVGVELNPEYNAIARRRIAADIAKRLLDGGKKPVKRRPARTPTPAVELTLFPMVA